MLLKKLIPCARNERVRPYNDSYTREKETFNGRELLIGVQGIYVQWRRIRDCCSFDESLGRVWGGEKEKRESKFDIKIAFAFSAACLIYSWQMMYSTRCMELLVNIEKGEHCFILSIKILLKLIL